jgi:NAD(P)-dependent dehydrogenase (short-subunit alcohol dehydrogenase family)
LTPVIVKGRIFGNERKKIMIHDVKSGAIGADPEAVWLVTGCSSGFGKSLSRLLSKNGRRLVATARDIAALGHLAASEHTLKATLDVTKPDTITRALKAGMDAFGRIDVVVNNAGIGVIGPVEDVTDEQVRKQFEVNVFGILNVIRATAPILRAQRRGFYINFASMAGQISIDSLGIYSGSKFAVEGLSEALRAELEPYGVGVMIIEPGPFNTEWLGKNAVWGPANRDRYPKVWEYVDEMKKVYADRAIVGNPDRAAVAIVAAAALENPPSRLPVHEMSFDATRRKIMALQSNLDRVAPTALSVHYSD